MARTIDPPSDLEESPGRAAHDALVEEPGEAAQADEHRVEPPSEAGIVGAPQRGGELVVLGAQLAEHAPRRRTEELPGRAGGAAQRAQRSR